MKKYRRMFVILLLLGGGSALFFPLPTRIDRSYEGIHVLETGIPSVTVTVKAWYLRYFFFDDTSKGMLGFTLVTVIYAMSLQGRSFREKIRT